MPKQRKQAFIVTRNWLSSSLPSIKTPPPSSSSTNCKDKFNPHLVESKICKMSTAYFVSSPGMVRQRSKRVCSSPRMSTAMRSRKEGSAMVELLQSISGKVARVFRRGSSGRKVSPKYSSDLFVGRPFEASVDAHRSQAVEDCIEFLNSRRSFQRSYSVSEYSSH